MSVLHCNVLPFTIPGRVRFFRFFYSIAKPLICSTDSLREHSNHLINDKICFITLISVYVCYFVFFLA